jgi:hypothetical protein
MRIKTGIRGLICGFNKQYGVYKGGLIYMERGVNTHFGIRIRGGYAFWGKKRRVVYFKREWDVMG